MIVIDAQGLKASRPNRPLFADVSLTVSDGDRIGVVAVSYTYLTLPTILRV